MSGVIAGIGLALSAAGSGVSFAQAAKARREQRTAMNQQKKLMQKAKERAEKNFYETLNVPIDAFENQYKQNQQVAAQALAALQQGDARNLAAGVGGLQQAAAQANETVRTGMQQALYDNAAMKAKAKDAMNQQLIEMEVGAAADQAQMARDYNQQYAQGIQGGISAASQAVQQASSLVPLFGTSKADRAGQKLESGFGTSETLGKTIEEGGTGLTQKQRADRLRKLELTPREVRQLKTGGNIDIEKAKELFTGDDPRFKNLQDGIGDVTDLVSLQKLLYGY
tara:strand:- start:1513 stop:2358 length:846 start_codon:yes stop_codon:yes gene_type:complete